MKLVTYQRPGAVWPNFGRLLNLNDELERLFETPLPTWAPALDVHEDKEKFTVNLELPGLKREDISVHLEDGSLVISGERKAETVSEGTEVHRQERYYGKFSRALTLPVAVASDKVKASFKDGILSVTLPKAEEAKPKQIDVTVN
ncbi:MAG TPA: Hsp20/alpha crystallin family protein [Candidatus Acidoferrales bacterium]|jgi:HSP20 family protein|nr:Hsp20/alpha crystallin family protein [Candidatus Acidoferrales bacterium]